MENAAVIEEVTGERMPPLSGQLAQQQVTLGSSNEIRRFPAKILPFDSAQGASWLSGVEDSGYFVYRKSPNVPIRPLNPPKLGDFRAFQSPPILGDLGG